MKRVLAVFLPLLVAYAGTWIWIWDSWHLEDSYYSHGPLVPLVAAAVIFARRRTWSAAPARVEPAGWWLLGPGLFLHLAGAALMIDSLSALSLCLSVPGAALLAVGRARLRSLWPALWLVVFAVPLPIFVTGKLAFALKEFAIDRALELGNALGLGAERLGARIRVPGQDELIPVADPCSGLRTIVALTTLGYCVAFFVGPSGWRRWILLASALPIAVVTNVLRIAAICFVARDYGVRYATTTAHELLGWLAWAVDFALLLAVDFAFGGLRRRRSS